MSIKISPKNEKDLLDLVKKLHSNLSILQYNDVLYSLCNLIKIDDINDRKIKRSLIKKTVRITKNYKRLTVYNFKKRLLIEITAFQNIPKKNFWILFPTNIRYRQPISNRLRIKLNNSYIYIRSYSQINNNFDLKKIRTNPIFMGQNYSRYLPAGKIYFMIKQEGRDYSDALNFAYEKFELLISIINFIKASNRFMIIRIPQAGPPPFLEIFPPEYMFIFNYKRNFVNYGFTTEKHDRRDTTISQQLMTGILNTINELNKKDDNQLKTLLTNSFRLYNSALEKTNSQHMFLTFWQVIENITLLGLIDSKFNEYIKKRLLIADSSKNINKHAINEVCSLRNQFVHSGNINLTDTDIMFVKLFSEICIRFLWKQTDYFENRTMLDKYYRYIGTNHSELNERKFVIDKII